MSMNADFQDAHARHWEDAEHLFQVQRWANADHLYGLAAECGLKALIERLLARPLDKSDRLHVMEHKQNTSNAWERYVSYNMGALGSQYTLPAENPFEDWNVSDRYANRACFSLDHVQAHRNGARLVHQLNDVALYGSGGP